MKAILKGGTRSDDFFSFFPFQNTLENREFKNNFHVLNCILSNVDLSRSGASRNFLQIIILSNFIYRAIHSHGNLCMRATNENRKNVFFAFFFSSNNDEIFDENSNRPMKTCDSISKNK